MSFPTARELCDLCVSAQDFVPEAEARRPPTFLTLAPTTSASYPTQRKAPAAPPTKPLTSSPKIEAVTPSAAEAAPAPAQSADEGAASLIKHRRSSSITSNSSTTSVGKLRFLKLGPVHGGEGDGTGDWSEVSVTE